MPQQIEVPGMGVVEFPDGMSDDQISAVIQRVSPPSQRPQLKAPPAGPPSDVAGYAMDVAKSAGTGLAQGAIGLAGLPGDLQAVAGEAGKWLSDKMPDVQLPQWAQDIYNKLDTPQARKYAEKYGRRADVSPQFLNSAQIQGAVEDKTGEFYKPQSTPGKFANTVGQFAPSAVMMGGGPAAMIANAVIPGVGSEGAGQLAQKYAPQHETAARIGGAVAAPLGVAGARRVVTPFPTSPERTAAVDVLRNEGVTDITAGQATGRKGLQYLEAERGAGNRLAESSGEQFTAAALRRTGENANRATPEVIDNAFNRLGQQFEGLAARNVAQLDNDFANDLRQAVGQYAGQVAEPNRAPAVANFVQEILQHAQQTGGALPGNVYQSLRSRMETAARGMSNPEARNAIRDVREALDDAMERSIAANNPADLGAWRETRNQYRNLITVADASTRAGTDSHLGLISPANLRNSTINTQGRRNYARGEGDLSELARAGTAVLTPLPNSGTAGRTFAQNLGTGIPALASALAGSAAGSTLGPVGAAAGGAAGLVAGAALPSAVGHAATSGAGRAYLRNQLWLPPADQAPASIAALVRALTAYRQQDRAAR
jgi:hypothetical protein